jgi:hypothetical protein
MDKGPTERVARRGEKTVDRMGCLRGGLPSRPTRPSDRTDHPSLETMLNPISTRSTHLLRSRPRPPLLVLLLFHLSVQRTAPLARTTAPARAPSHTLKTIRLAHTVNLLLPTPKLAINLTLRLSFGLYHLNILNLNRRTRHRTRSTPLLTLSTLRPITIPNINLNRHTPLPTPNTLSLLLSLLSAPRSTPQNPLLFNSTTHTLTTLIDQTPMPSPRSSKGSISASLHSLLLARLTNRPTMTTRPFLLLPLPSTLRPLPPSARRQFSRTRTRWTRTRCSSSSLLLLSPSPSSTTLLP